MTFPSFVRCCHELSSRNRIDECRLGHVVGARGVARNAYLAPAGFRARLVGDCTVETDYTSGCWRALAVEPVVDKVNGKRRFDMKPGCAAVRRAGDTRSHVRRRSTQRADRY